MSVGTRSAEAGQIFASTPGEDLNGLASPRRRKEPEDAGGGMLGSGAAPSASASSQIAAPSALERAHAASWAAAVIGAALKLDQAQASELGGGGELEVLVGRRRRAGRRRSGRGRR